MSLYDSVELDCMLRFICAGRGSHLLSHAQSCVDLLECCGSLSCCRSVYALFKRPLIYGRIQGGFFDGELAGSCHSKPFSKHDNNICLPHSWHEVLFLKCCIYLKPNMSTIVKSKLFNFRLICPKNNIPEVWFLAKFCLANFSLAFMFCFVFCAMVFFWHTSNETETYAVSFFF
ncbi:hypothetical protein ATANTOWER_026507 [Ataeniobius toweri]|uniref:Uncharacterized protein n=1 Tax=Ataeniobius toweri TaxID=208326 RepID=A0ABU7BWY5_9TELE|nr:hypothetical protein [Ataeniobius toweri]